MEIVGASGLKLGVDPMGGAAVHYWEPIAEHYGLSLEIVNPIVDPTFAFMTLDKDGKIRMDCSSPYAMQGLIQLKDGLTSPLAMIPMWIAMELSPKASGLLNPNHYLTVAIWYLFQNRPDWNQRPLWAKPWSPASMIDRVAEYLGTRVV